MSRSFAAVLLILAILMATVGTYLFVFPMLKATHVEEATTGMTTAGRLLQEMDLADEGRLLRKLSVLSQRASLRTLLRERPAEASERIAWFTRLHAEVAGLATLVREVSPVKDLFILSRDGLGLARSGDTSWSGKAPTDNGQVLQAIREAGRGQRAALIVQDGEALSRAVVVPVRAGERVAAILYATFPLDDTLAKSRGSDLSMSVQFAYVTRKGIASGTLSDRARGTWDEILAAADLQPSKLIDGKGYAPRLVKGTSDRWLIGGFPVMAAGGKGLCGIIVLRGVDEVLGPFDQMTLWLFLFMGGIPLGAMLIVILLLGGRYNRSLKRLEQDALEMVTGRERKRFTEGGPTGIRSLAEALNKLQPGTPITEGPFATEEDGLTPPLPPDEDTGSSDHQGESMEKIGEERTEEMGMMEAARDEEEMTDESERSEQAPAPPAQHDDWELEATIKQQAPSPEEDQPAAETTTAQSAEPPGEEEQEAEQVDEEAPTMAVQPPYLNMEEPPPLPSPEPSTADDSDPPAEQDAEEQDEEIPGPHTGKATVDTAPMGSPPLDTAEREGTEEPSPAPQAEPATEPPEKENEEVKYYRGVFDAFVRSKQEIGESIEKLNFERFVRKLRKQEEILKAKHGCRAVRFEVMIKNEQVSLRPKIIR